MPQDGADQRKPINRQKNNRGEFAIFDGDFGGSYLVHSSRHEVLQMQPNPESGAAVQVRLTGSEFASLENWRRSQKKIPPRSEAIREAIRRLVFEPYRTAQTKSPT
jgi:hypothetical protein